MNVETLRTQYDDGSYPDGFWDWLEDNMHVLEQFIGIAEQAKARGYQHWSARGISEVLRWQSSMREHGQDALKVNDHSTPGLARLAMKLRPELEGFFETRVQSGKREARRLDGSLYGG